MTAGKVPPPDPDKELPIRRFVAERIATLADLLAVGAPITALAEVMASTAAFVNDLREGKATGVVSALASVQAREDGDA